MNMKKKKDVQKTSEVLEKRSIKKTVHDVLIVLFGTMLYGIAYNMFLEPSGIILGGMTGVGMIINKLVPQLTVGTWVMILNLPLILICIKVFGISFLYKTIVGTVGSSLAIDIFYFLPTLTDELILCALFGGVLSGIGLGIIYGHGYNTGGTDMIIWLLKRVFKKTSAGTFIMFVDSTVVASAVLVFHDFSKVFYSAITIFSATKSTDAVLGGFDKGQLVFVFSKKYNEIADEISKKLNRGITVLDATGWYSKEKTNVLLCAVRPKQVYELKELAQKIDKDAFMVFTSANRISGEGFESAKF